MAERPILCPQCFDSMLQPVEGVKLLAVGASEVKIESPVTIYRCSSWHLFAVFTVDRHP